MKISCYYLSPKRASEIIDDSRLRPLLEDAPAFRQVVGHGLERRRVLTAIEKALWTRLAEHPLPTLTELLLDGRVVVGSVFLHRGTFTGTGIIARADPQLRADVSAGEGRVSLCVPLSLGDLTTVSAADAISGKRDLVLIGLVSQVHGEQVEVRPIAIGIPLFDFFDAADAELQFLWTRGMLVAGETIDSFREMRRIRPPAAEELERLRDIPEAEVKRAFAEVIGEPYVGKDWGGEASDLFSDRVVLNGVRTPTAFIFKGPSRFRPMTLAELGRNGDQLVRAFNEPVDLVVIQHCHQIAAPVWEVARALASRLGRPRRYCMMNGAETYRFLRAYGKCGLDAAG